MTLRTAKVKFKHDCREHDPDGSLPHTFMPGMVYNLPKELEAYFDEQGWLEGSDASESGPQTVQPDSTHHGAQS